MIPKMRKWKQEGRKFKVIHGEASPGFTRSVQDKTKQTPHTPRPHTPRPHTPPGICSSLSGTAAAALTQFVAEWFSSLKAPGSLRSCRLSLSHLLQARSLLPVPRVQCKVFSSEESFSDYSPPLLKGKFSITCPNISFSSTPFIN